MHREEKKKVTISYSDSFISLARQIFSDEPHKYSELVRAIELKDDITVRILIDEKMDSYNVNPSGILTAEKANQAVINLIKHSEVNKLFSQYMQLYEELVDNE